MSVSHTVLNKLFGKAEEVNGHERCETYLYRWEVLKTRWCKVMIHHFVGDDWSRDFHDHPKNFVTVGIKGSYLEETPNGTEIFKSPWIRKFGPHHQHRVSTPWGPCWTLVFVGRQLRDWGFWHDGKWYHWKKYVEEKGGPADKMKSCD